MRTLGINAMKHTSSTAMQPAMGRRGTREDGSEMGTKERCCEVIQIAINPFLMHLIVLHKCSLTSYLQLGNGS